MTFSSATRAPSRPTCEADEGALPKLRPIFHVVLDRREDSRPPEGEEDGAEAEGEGRDRRVLVEGVLVLLHFHEDLDEDDDAGDGGGDHGEDGGLPGRIRG